MSEKHATLNLTQEDGSEHSIDLAVHSGTLGPDVVDVGKLTANGYFTYDPGFTSTASCESQITFIDGEKGVLLHRGYPIDFLSCRLNCPCFVGRDAHQHGIVLRRTRAQLLRRAVRQQRTPRDNNRTVANGVDLFQNMRRNDDRFVV